VYELVNGERKASPENNPGRLKYSLLWGYQSLSTDLGESTITWFLTDMPEKGFYSNMSLGQNEQMFPILITSNTLNS